MNVILSLCALTEDTPIALLTVGAFERMKRVGLVVNC